MLTFSRCKKRCHTTVTYDAKTRGNTRGGCIGKRFAPDLHQPCIKGHFVVQNKTGQAIA